MADSFHISNSSRFIPPLTYWVKAGFLTIFVAILFTRAVISAESDSVNASHSLTSSVLTALMLENEREYDIAASIWQVLSDSSSKARESYYRNLFFSNPTTVFQIPPLSEDLTRRAVWYLVWRKQWGEALILIDKYGRHVKSGPVLELERISAYMALGKYEKAQSFLSSPEYFGSSLQPYRLILSCQLASITEDYERFGQCLREIDAKFLYLPYSALHPIFWEKSWDKYAPEVLRDIVRYPSGKGAVEDALRQAFRDKKWKIVENILLSEALTRDTPYAWPYLAEAYVNRKKLTELERSLKRLKPVGSRDYYEYTSRYLIETRNWKGLERLARDYIEAYPDILDGYLYLAESYEMSGQAREYEAMMSEIRNRLNQKGG